MSTTQLTYKVGAKLFFVNPLRANSRREVKVTRVGRKWAELDNGYRVEMATGRVESGGFRASGKLYASLAAYEAERDLGRAWDALRGDLYHVTRFPPKGVTVERIAKARRLLGLEPPNG